MSITGNARKLTFVSKNLGKDIDLMLMFEPPKLGELYTDLYPVCWKVLQFSASNISTAVALYTADTAFMKEDDSNIVSALNVQKCQVREPNYDKFAYPQSHSIHSGWRDMLVDDQHQGKQLPYCARSRYPGLIQCKIQSTKPADVAFGIVGKDQSVSPIFKWNGLAVDSNLAVKLSPVLKIYGVSDYQSSEILRGDVTTEELFNQDLTKLPHESTWNVVRDPSSLQLKIVRAK
ncbi:hypothetical protein JR316_0011248 [Psilocybe cubensis]|uniref:Uncharacterized protein n=2 Tax=Psilocybe cubensis TaxID=181762 RepID=A0A8H7XU67_PSICU|nr:hypothetical protein JR316_0011248 [Psilocybe cubensis]KAH9475689.1 hypothetical protein JR316_0011248 [Psilocybe cubensis]